LTDGVSNLYMPQWGNGGMWGTYAAEYSPEWKVVVRGEKTAKSYLDNRAGGIKNGKYEKAGTYFEAPPLAAYREWGGGRLAAYSCAAMHLTLNTRYTEDYPCIQEFAGDQKKGIPSDGYRLFFNTIRFLGEKAQQSPILGSYVEKPLPSFDPAKSVDVGRQKFPAPIKQQSRGVIGLHSAYSDGQGSVAEFCQAAKEAKMDFVVFSEALEKLSSEKFAALRKDCQRESTAEFYACPGIEFSDSSGLRWVFWGENVRYPEKSMLDNDGRVFYWGRYAAWCDRNPSLCINYSQINKLGKAQFLWWYFRTPVAVYQRGKLQEETLPEYLLALSDIRGMAPIIYNGIYSPQVLAEEARISGVNRVYGGIDQAKLFLSSKNIYHCGLGYTSEGPEIVQWSALNMHPQYRADQTAGSQRVRCRFAVSSPEGIREVRVHDGAKGIIRNFSAAGSKEYAVEFELLNSRQQFLVLEVIDEQGRRAVSNALTIKHPYYDISRCTDNLNLLGSSTLLQFPYYHGYITASRAFENLGTRRTANGGHMPFAGIDTAGTFTYAPQSNFAVAISSRQGEQIAGTNANDDYSSHEIDYVFSSSGISHISAFSNKRVDTSKRHLPDKRVTYGNAAFYAQSSEQPLADLRYDSYLLRSRIRPELKLLQPLEASKEYRGGVMIHVAKITFKKDIELTGNIPIRVTEVDPGPAYYRAKNGYCNRIVAKTSTGLLDTDIAEISGVLQQGGYLTVLSRESARRVVLLAAADKAEPAFQVASSGRMTLGFGKEGQHFQAGERLELRVVIGNLTGEPDDLASLERFAQCFPLVSGDGIETCEAIDGAVLCTADGGDWVCDKPFRINKIEDNGSAAYYELDGSRRFIFAPVHEGGMYFQSQIDNGGKIWAGNIFLADHPSLKLTLVQDGQAEEAQAWLEIHNPTHEMVRTKLHSPASTPHFGGSTFVVEIPAGTSSKKMLEKTKK